MSDLRPTFAYIGTVEHRLKSAAALLGVSENTLRTTLIESGIEVRRANHDNPNAPAVRLFDLPTIFQIAEYRRAKKLTKGPEGKKPIVIAIEIIKGGTGKTTTAAEVAVQLQLQGLKVLGIDIDIQANFTQLMGYEADLTEDEAALYGLTEEGIVKGTFATICGPFIERYGRPVDAKGIIKYPFGSSGPAIIPADTFFSDLEHDISKTSGKRELVFQKFFKESLAGNVPGLNVGDFDVVLFDCPPNISFVATNALASADIVIAPVKMESFSVKGLSRLIGEIQTLKAEYGNEVKDPELIILPTYYSTNLPRVSRMQEKLSQYRANTSPVSISQSEEFPKSTDNYMPLTVIKPTCQPVKEYRMFVDHLIKKINEVSKARAS
ncbi:ParA family protein [Sulfuricystis multivorans]|uniref:ParA family protein n=1 Tax=Sulfuricystis multivorans TaxID=2211108 RepID=UPI000F83151C|nr:ParA family protein [Sulfuricystis multivorans]